MDDYEKERKNQILAMLAEIVLASMPGAGEKETIVPGLFLVRKNEVVHSANYCVSRPMAYLCLQGHKTMRVGTVEEELKPGTCGVVCLDSPCATCFLEASPEQPYLAAHFLLDAKILTELLTEMLPGSRPGCKSGFNGYSMEASLEFLETFLRLAKLIRTPEQAPILAPLVLRELHYLLLIEPQGVSLQNLYMSGARDNRIIEAIAILKNRLDSSISVQQLARQVNMSVSSLHRQFKSVTGYSPLQYHKKLRLCEAQRLMLVDNQRADMAAMIVGYESITQFNREYKRMFGQPPRRDINSRRQKLIQSGDLDYSGRDN